MNAAAMLQMLREYGHNIALNGQPGDVLYTPYYLIGAAQLVAETLKIIYLTVPMSTFSNTDIITLRGADRQQTIRFVLSDGPVGYVELPELAIAAHELGWQVEHLPDGGGIRIRFDWEREDPPDAFPIGPIEQA